MGFIITFIDLLFRALWIAILGTVLMSWIDPSGSSRVSQVLREITDPILTPVRKILPTVGMLDFSPLVALLLLEFIRMMIISVLS
jgi:YggT family protein